ncbi:hypothetical protein AMECASPLE_020770 [Ameca splendens]|uniref:Uncharacterized protein n=1 Tax=Ameca splendens TaxID=208324 RepID=A0ABV0ZNN5_9TELE
MSFSSHQRTAILPISTLKIRCIAQLNKPGFIRSWLVQQQQLGVSDLFTYSHVEVPRWRLFWSGNTQQILYTLLWYISTKLSALAPLHQVITVPVRDGLNAEDKFR